MSLEIFPTDIIIIQGGGKMVNKRMIDSRKKAGLTQKQLAERVGLSQGMICRVEQGLKEPSKKYRMKLAKELGVSVEWLFYEQINV
jgi:putative transcriptional regulator